MSYPKRAPVICGGLAMVAILSPGCKFIYEPTAEPRYRWVGYPKGWEEHPSGRYVFNGTEFINIASVPEASTMSKRWRNQ